MASLDSSLLREEPWPEFTEAQVAYLEKLYPPRCILPMEPLEAHLRYAGASALVMEMKRHVRAKAPTSTTTLDEDEEEAMLDSDAVTQALAAQDEEENQ